AVAKVWMLGANSCVFHYCNLKRGEKTQWLKMILKRLNEESAAASRTCYSLKESGFGWRAKNSKGLGGSRP
ncbi:MAG: hypothetical protein OSB07_14505, partial [Dehalococcoidia bacterium]|nr:hypothetical protein [Dehalococcoidia bacterium]